MHTIYTVTAAGLLRDAEQIERDANQSLKAWILCGMSDRYGAAMSTAHTLRRAASERSLYVRREILRNAGFTVLRPQDAGRR